MSFLRMLRMILWGMAQPIARLVNRGLRGQDYGYAVLRLPRARAWELPPEVAAHRSLSLVGPTATTEQVVAILDGNRSLMSGEHFTLKPPGELVLACCDCGAAHRLSYTPVVDEVNELALDVLIKNDDVASDKIRGSYDFPFQAIRRVGKNARIIGGR